MNYYHIRNVLMCGLLFLPAIISAVFLALLLWHHNSRNEYCSKACAPYSFTVGAKGRCVCDLTTKVIE